jgi:DNA-binding LacI/PurR family transcriptional regulator
MPRQLLVLYPDKDIAKLAGVSCSAVSKTINNYTDISEETRKKIQKVISKNNYCPSKSAQILRKGRNDTIAFISGRIASRFTVEVLSAIERRTFSTGKFVHGIIPYSTNYDKKIINEIFGKMVYGREASAVVALAMNPAPGLLIKCRKAGIPVILIENYTQNAHTVNTDNHRGGFMAAEYPIKKGRKRIALICGGLKAGSKCGFSYAAVERKSGFEDALKRHSIRFDERFLELSSDYTITEGMALFDRFVKKGARLDAIFCAFGDLTAVGVMESAKKRGIMIPDDLAVIGFDDSTCSAFLNPPLTTVRQPIERIGAEVLDVAIDAIEGKLKAFKHILLEPGLIIRRSKPDLLTSFSMDGKLRKFKNAVIGPELVIRKST